MALFLYDAIKLVLRKNARPMTTEEIANQLNATKLYVKSNICIDVSEIKFEKNVLQIFLHITSFVNSSFFYGILQQKCL